MDPLPLTTSHEDVFDRTAVRYEQTAVRLARISACLLGLFGSLFLLHVGWDALGIRADGASSGRPISLSGSSPFYLRYLHPTWIPELVPDEWANVSLLVATAVAFVFATAAAGYSRARFLLMVVGGSAILLVPIANALVLRDERLAQGIALSVAVLALPATTVAAIVCPDQRLARRVPRVIAATFFLILVWQLTNALPARGGLAYVQRDIANILIHRPKADLLGLGLMQLTALLAIFAPLPLGKRWSPRVIIWLSVAAFALMTINQAWQLNIWQGANLDVMEGATLTSLWFAGMASMVFAAIAIVFAGIVLGRHQRDPSSGFRGQGDAVLPILDSDVAAPPALDDAQHHVE